MNRLSYRWFDERAAGFFTNLEDGLNRQRPSRVKLKQRFTAEVERHFTLDAEQRSRLRHSFNLAFWAYRKVRRRRGEAYVFHPLRAALVVTWAMAEHDVWDLDLLHLALLHDAYEEVSAARYNQFFIRSAVHIGSGPETARGVADLTKGKAQSPAEYYNQLLRCQNWRVLLVKVVDRIDNVWTLDRDDPVRSRRKLEETNTWFPFILGTLRTVVESEIRENTLSRTWRDVVEFLAGYLWYAVSAQENRFVTS